MQHPDNFMQKTWKTWHVQRQSGDSRSSYKTGAICLALSHIAKNYFKKGWKLLQCITVDIFQKHINKNQKMYFISNVFFPYIFKLKTD